jgi:ABC-type bacteriocin/lantibiotic exporter with double-glycine peptidase domain
MRRKLIAFTGLALILAAGLIFIGFVVVIATPDGPRRFSAWRVGGGFAGTEGVVLQDKRNNCGPAALQMAFQHFGIASTVKEIEEQVGLTERGSSMLALKEMAQTRGLEAKGWRLDFSQLTDVRKPVIAFVRKSHFVVVDSISKRRIVHFRDPAKGARGIREESWLKMWEGETLVFQK